MIKYRTNFNEIRSFEVIKETPKQIVFIKTFMNGGCQREERENKTTSYSSWHDTFEDAQNHLLTKQQSKIDMYERNLIQAKADFMKILGMKETKTE